MAKAPAFQLYAADFYMDTASWTIEEVGIYTRLLFYQWVNGSIPMDEIRLARIAGCTPKSFQKWWCQIKLKFSVWDHENLINLRLEETRQKQLNHSEKQSNRAKVRWENHNAAAYPVAMPERCSSSSSSSSTSKDNNPPTPRKRGMVYADDFLIFWKAYPKKVGKDAALRAWKGRTGTRPVVAELVAAIQKQAQSDQWQKENGQYIPNPATWLNQGRWADEVETAEQSSIDAWLKAKQGEANGTV